MAGISVKLPLFIGEQDGPYGLNKTLKDSIKQNLKMLMLTIPGERVMDPNFGVGLMRYLFENDTADLRNRISDRIRKQIALYMPFLKVRETILPSLQDMTLANNHMLSITIKYYVEAISQEDILNIKVSPYDSSESVF